MPAIVVQSSMRASPYKPTATLGLVAGINPKVVSEALGHSSVTITLDLYSHVLPNMQDELAGAIANLLKRGTSVDNKSQQANQNLKRLTRHT